MDKIRTFQSLAKAGYKNNKNTLEGWEQEGEPYINNYNGFVAKVFKNETSGEIVISYSGTELSDGPVNFFTDAVNDLHMVVRNIPSQAHDALAVYYAIREKYPNAKITLTGHSLGGSLVQIVAKITGALGYTYNAFATGYGGKEYSNIINVVNTEDFVGMSDINNHPGKIYVLPNSGKNVLMPQIGFRRTLLEAHEIDNMCFTYLKAYKRGTLESFIDKMDSGVKHKKFAAGRESIGRVLDVIHTIKPVASSVYHVYKNAMHNSGVAASTHWVTIKGNHVLLPINY